MDTSSARSFDSSEFEMSPTENESDFENQSNPLINLKTFENNEAEAEPAVRRLERLAKDANVVITYANKKKLNQSEYQAGTPRQAFTPVQEWEGYVSEIHEDYFVADIVDTTNSNSSLTGNVEFLIEELSPSDAKMLELGAVFRWSIGYKATNGTRARLSQIVFRNLPIWTKNDLADIVRSNDEGIDKLNWK